MPNVSLVAAAIVLTANDAWATEAVIAVPRVTLTAPDAWPANPSGVSRNSAVPPDSVAVTPPAPSCAWTPTALSSMIVRSSEVCRTPSEPASVVLASVNTPDSDCPRMVTLAGVATVPSAFSVPSWTVSEPGLTMTATGMPAPKLIWLGRPWKAIVAAIWPLTPAEPIVNCAIWVLVWVIDTPSDAVPSVIARLVIVSWTVPVLSRVKARLPLNDWPRMVAVTLGR